jgi:hypothetical protein
MDHCHRGALCVRRGRCRRSSSCNFAAAPLNPAWPPHAKFHNGQTMLLGVSGGFVCLYLLFASGPLTHRMFFLAAGAAAMYWASMVLAPLFPGTAWYDPEFKDASHRPFGFSPPQVLSYVLCGLEVLAVILADLSA